MCPDAELLSSWVDDEVPSPWKERIASHLDTCQGCAEKVASFRRLSMRLGASGRYDEAAVVARVASRLGIAMASALPSETLAQKSDSPGPRRGKLALPLPLAAAAAVAFLLVGGITGRLFMGPGAGSPGGAASSLASASESTAKGGVPAGLVSGASGSANNLSGSPTMDSLVRYLEAQNAPVSITIQLPANGSYAGGGAPMIVKQPPAEAVSLPPSTQGLGFVMSGPGK